MPHSSEQLGPLGGSLAREQKPFPYTDVTPSGWGLGTGLPVCLYMSAI